MCSKETQVPVKAVWQRRDTVAQAAAKAAAADNPEFAEAAWGRIRMAHMGLQPLPLSAQHWVIQPSSVLSFILFNNFIT